MQALDGDHRGTKNGQTSSNASVISGLPRRVRREGDNGPWSRVQTIRFESRSGASHITPDVLNSGQLVDCWLGHTSCMGLLPVAHPESMNTGGQLVVPAVATQMGTFLGAHRKARTAV